MYHPSEVHHLVLSMVGTHIPTGIGEAFTNLLHLVFTPNSLRFLDRRNFIQMTKLKKLDLSNGEIQFIPEDTFWDVISLEKLSLASNQIERIPVNTLMNLRVLKSLDLSSNKLTHLDKGLFEHNKELTAVHFGSNKLKSIATDFTSHHEWKVISLIDNDCIKSHYRDDDENSSIEAFQTLINRLCYAPEISTQHVARSDDSKVSYWGSFLIYFALIFA